MAMLSHRLRRVLVALPSSIQRSFPLSRVSNFPSVPSLLPRSLVRQPREFGRSPAKLFSTSQYQYDPYTGEDSFTPDNEGCDFNHWLITMDFPKENPPSREEMISIFEQTCAKGLGISLEEAKKKIYAICTTSYQGFQATMTIGEVEKFRELPGIQYIIPDSYVDVENKVYGGDKYENGVITPGPIPVPTREGFDSLEKEGTSGQEQAQRSQTPPDQGLTSGKVQDQGTQTPLDQGPTSGELQGSQTPLDQRSFKQGQGTLAPIQGQMQAQRSQMVSFQESFKQGLGQGLAERSQMPSSQGGFKQGQGSPSLGQRQVQGSQIPSFQRSFKQGQGTIIHGQGQTQGSQKPPQGSYNQGQGIPTPGQGQSQGSQVHSSQVGYSQWQGAQKPPYHGLPSNYGQGAVANNNQGPAQGNFIQGTQENYNQLGHTPQSCENSGPAQGTGSPGFGHGQGRGGSLYQGSYNKGQGNPMPGVAQVQGGQLPSYQGSYSQYLGAWVPSYYGNYNQGTPSNYGQWAFANCSQVPPHSNFLQGPQSNYNQGGQWHFSPQNGGHYGTAQFGHWYPGPPQGQGNQMPSYLGNYNQWQGTPIPGQWQCQHCGMLSYQTSYSKGQGAPVPPYHGNYNQGTPANFNQGLPVTRGNYNLQSGGNYGPAHESAGNPGFGQGFPGHGQNQTFQQEHQGNVAGEWSNNNKPADPTEAGKIPH